jgi:hypothetical protein
VITSQLSFEILWLDDYIVLSLGWIITLLSMFGGIILLDDNLNVIIWLYDNMDIIILLDDNILLFDWGYFF